MVIFHSYVSLPEGTSTLIAGKQQKSVTSWKLRVTLRVVEDPP